MFVMIIYKNEIPSIDSFFMLYKSTGWDKEGKKQKDQLYDCLKNSWCMLVAYHNEELVGCGRIISDGYLHAFITELMVHPDYQQKGIGKEILNRLVNKALESGINDIQLFCALGKQDFYLKNGFEERSEDAPGMQYRIGR